jgi:hypothetical protein
LSEQEWTGISDFLGGLKTVFCGDWGIGGGGDDSEASWLLDDGRLLGVLRIFVTGPFEIIHFARFSFSRFLGPYLSND